MIIQRPKGLVQVCSFNLEARSTLSDLYVYEIGNTSSLPFWRTSTLRRLHRPPRPPIISCIPAPCPEPPVWSLEAIMRHRPSEATHSTGYGLARRRRPYQPRRPLGAPPHRGARPRLHHRRGRAAAAGEPRRGGRAGARGVAAGDARSLARFKADLSAAFPIELAIGELARGGSITRGGAGPFPEKTPGGAAGTCACAPPPSTRTTRGHAVAWRPLLRPSLCLSKWSSAQSRLPDLASFLDDPNQ